MLFRSEPLPVILLALTVWLIYAADRAMDAFAGERSTPRHRFYRTYWKILAPVWVIAFSAACWLSLTKLPQPLLRSGFLLLGAVGVYFFIVHSAPNWWRKAWPKEAAVGVLFALGSSLGAWGRIRTWADVATVVLLSALCWINCAAIERWENRKWTDAGDAPGREGFPVGILSLGIAAAALFVFLQNRPVLATAEMVSALAF